MASQWATPFEHSTPTELAEMIRHLRKAQQAARTFGYNVADRELGEMIAAIIDEREQREVGR